MTAPVACPYCSKCAQRVNGTTIYPHRPELAHSNFYLCTDCDAYVGCHRAGTWFWVDGVKHFSDGTTALGRLADAPLRAAKTRAHAAFDPIWRAGAVPRRAAYAWLAVMLGIPADDCHIGMFDDAQCAAVLRAVESYNQYLSFQEA